MLHSKEKWVTLTTGVLSSQKTWGGDVTQWDTCRCPNMSDQVAGIKFRVRMD